MVRPTVGPCGRGSSETVRGSTALLKNLLLKIVSARLICYAHTQLLFGSGDLVGGHLISFLHTH